MIQQHPRHSNIFSYFVENDKECNIAIRKIPRSQNLINMQIRELNDILQNKTGKQINETTLKAKLVTFLRNISTLTRTGKLSEFKFLNITITIILSHNDENSTEVVCSNVASREEENTTLKPTSQSLLNKLKTNSKLLKRIPVKTVKNVAPTMQQEDGDQKDKVPEDLLLGKITTLINESSTNRNSQLFLILIAVGLLIQ